MSGPAPYELVIGLECHVELATRSKMFCGCAARHFAAAPNTLVCPVCLGLPGALPVPNRRAIELAIVAGLALHCETPAYTKFDRKNYLYPDLPKGYQISQYDLPLSVNGWIEIPASAGGTKRVGIRRAHLEEDTGRLFHGQSGGARYTLIDFNRSGVPLLEIVSEPDLSSPAEALDYLEALREMLVFAEVSEFRLEEGAGRFDVNVSIRFTEDSQVRWPPQSEIKNLNSYRALEEAVAYESRRLWEEWRAGGPVRQRTSKITVGWSPERRRTFPQRQKEEVDDYRYFPEPDLVALAPSAETIAALRAALPEMPVDRRARFARDYGLSDYDARVLVSDRALADYYEEVVSAAGGVHAKSVANWVMGEVLRKLREQSLPTSRIPIQPSHLGAVVQLVSSGTLSSSSAKDLFSEVWDTGAEPHSLVRDKGLAQVSDVATIEAAVDVALAENPQAVADLRAGKQRAMAALVGAVMKRTAGKANPALVNRLIAERIT